MNFAFDYVKHKSTPQNDDFYFDIETPRGHFFTILDFGPHDYANLNASLQGKLETIVSSFVSVSSFSADLFLGFLAKEINNFVHNLAEQSGGPELFCSAALCLVSGDHLSYFLRGDTRISILNGGRVQPLPGDQVEGKQRKSTQLGAEGIEAPMSDEVHVFTLHDDDAVLLMTRGVAEALESQEFAAELLKVDSSDSQLLCNSVIKAGAVNSEDRALVVIAGPYERPADSGLAELKKSVASLEERLNALTESEHQKGLELGVPELNAAAQFEQDFGEQVAELKDYLRTKAATIDLLELDEKVKDLSATLAGKADTADVLELQRDVLKLGLTSNAAAPNEAAEGAETTSVQTAPAKRTFTFTAAFLVLIISLVAGFAGGWLSLRRNRMGPEQWSVKTSGNQIAIARLDGSQNGNVTLTVAQPLKSAGEQTFSTFADVQRYVNTITTPENPATQTQNSQPSLPTAGQTPAPAPSALPVEKVQSPTAESPAATLEITVAPGDSLNELARRFNTTAQRLKELNPQMNWPRIHSGQKVLVPTPAGG